MSTHESADRLITALRDWGCEVRAYQPDGQPWWSHTTPGDWHPAGVIHHHTTGPKTMLTNGVGQSDTLQVLRNGRTGLPGPLCHGAPAMVPDTHRAQVWLIGWGNVNHAGAGSSRVLDQVKTGTYAGRDPGTDDTDGNPWFWGLEYMHPGDSTAWPDALLEVGHRAACAFGEFSGWTPATVPGRQAEHREWTSRKIDRSWMGNVRRAVTAIMEGQDMALTKDDAAKVWDADVIPAPENAPDLATNPTWRADHALGRVVARCEQLRTTQIEQKAALAALTAKVDAIAVGGVDVSLLAHAVVDLMSTRLES